MNVDMVVGLTYGSPMRFSCYRHGQINFKDTKTKCRHLKKLTLSMDFVAVCWHYEQFSNLLSGSPPPSPPLQSAGHTGSVSPVGDHIQQEFKHSLSDQI